MALDKQQILSELGSVMNKLQSADCGCMGKMFSNQGQYTNQGQYSNQGGQGAAEGGTLPTCGGCRRGYCHGHGGGGYGSHSYGYGAPYAGEPYSMNRPCTGMQYNPPKLYADTYNYLNHNLMQPVVKEVYDDLKSINPANSVVNNPMASQMGLQQQNGGSAMQGNIGMAQNQMPVIPNDMGGMQDPSMTMNLRMGNQQMANQQMDSQQMGYQQVGNQQMGNQQMGNAHMNSAQISGQQPMVQMLAGMGPDIVNMMQTDGKSSNMSGQVGQFTASMGAESLPSSQGQSGMTPMSTGYQGVGMAQGQYNSEMNANASNYESQQQRQYMQQQNIGNAINPNLQNSMGGNTQQNQENTGATYKVKYSNPAAQQMTANRSNQNYGQHAPGMAKFNEMFPGVTGGDLDFDPMSIAIQMNPANQHQAATSQMQKLMTGNKLDRVFDPSTNARSMQPAITGANAAAAALCQPATNEQTIPSANQQQMPVQSKAMHQNLQQGYTNAPQPNQASQPAYNNQIPQEQQPQHQQAYTALTGAPMMNQSQRPQQYQQQSIDPNARAIASHNLPSPDGTFDPNQQPQSYNTPEPDQMREPIFPADTSKNQAPRAKYQRNYDYNTLGQPVQMLPARMYHQFPEANVPQTLSPQPVTKYRNDIERLNVKNTVSKTSLMGSRPIGRTPSRSQLQQIYNQYKGSQSYTQQNIRSPAQGATFSEGKLNVALAEVNQHRHAPVERLGGDTLANNQIANIQIPIKGQPTGYTSDAIPVDNKPHGDIMPAKEPPIKKCRNGLQDMVYTSYPTSAAWSFHGNSDRRPYSPAYRFRSRA